MSNQYKEFEYDDLEINGKSYYASGTANATYTFVKGKMYMRNGDPGYPDEEDFEIDSIDFEAWEMDSEGNESKVTDKDVLETIESVLNDRLYDSDGWEFSEPDYEDYDDEY